LYGTNKMHKSHVRQRTIISANQISGSLHVKTTVTALNEQYFVRGVRWWPIARQIIPTLSIYSQFLTLLQWNLDIVLNHKVNSQCFIFSLDNLNEWTHPSLSLPRFNITWFPSLFLMGHLVVYLDSLILLLHFQ